MGPQLRPARRGTLVEGEGRRRCSTWACAFLYGLVGSLCGTRLEGRAQGPRRLCTVAARGRASCSAKGVVCSGVAAVAVFASEIGEGAVRPESPAARGSCATSRMLASCGVMGALV